MLRVAAVDLGATSARVAVVDLDREPLEAEIVHRYAHQPITWSDGSLRWDWERLMAEVEVGLERALEGGPLASIGVDTWGVDYGLLGDGGALLSPPYSYRDSRTDAWEAVADRLGRQRLYALTGIQLMAINTVFQLAAHDRRELDDATTLLMLPELVVHHLTGALTGEVTSAGTSALVDVATGTWSAELVDDLDLDPTLFPPIARAGAPVGRWRGVPVHLVGGHDTASAVAACSSPPGAAFVSAGTWFLVGALRSGPDLSSEAREANFSNEPAISQGVRFLKNVTGLWLLERCRAQWGGPPLATLVSTAEATAPGPRFDPNDARFERTADMEAEIRSAAALPTSADRAAVVRCIVDSIAYAVAGVVDQLGGLIGSPVTAIDVVGGGGQLPLLVELLRRATGVPVRVGPAEATAIGNALVQGDAVRARQC
ncbi:MAG: rhamnulokinase [Actinobacteria bacterium]|nr:rhamnulokinase [Actinomycetota bacterium]